MLTSTFLTKHCSHQLVHIPAPSARVEFEAPEELERSPSTSETLTTEPPPNPSVAVQEPSNSQQQQQQHPTQLTASEEGNVFMSHPEDTGLPVDTTLNSSSTGLNRPSSEAGPSTSIVPPDGTLKSQLKGTGLSTFISLPERETFFKVHKSNFNLAAQVLRVNL